MVETSYGVIEIRDENVIKDDADGNIGKICHCTDFDWLASVYCDFEWQASLFEWHASRHKH